MRSILGTILLLGVFTLAPATAWSQLPALSYTSGAGAVTDITGGVYNPGVTLQTTDGQLFDPCPPTQWYGANLGWGFVGDQPRSTGGDGLSRTADSNTVDAGGRTETTSASADATRGEARAFASADTSLPCIAFSDDNFISMAGAGRAFAQFYDTYTVVSAPETSTVNVNWSLRGSFSGLPSGYAGGGSVNLFVYLLPSPPPQAFAGPFSNAVMEAMLVSHVIFSNPMVGNFGSCFNQSCPPIPNAQLVNTGGTIDVGPAFEWATGRALAPGESFIIGTFLVAETRACGVPDGCNVLPNFTTDFLASASVIASGGAVVSATAFQPGQ